VAGWLQKIVERLDDAAPHVVLEHRSHGAAEPGVFGAVIHLGQLFREVLVDLLFLGGAVEILRIDAFWFFGG